MGIIEDAVELSVDAIRVAVHEAEDVLAESCPALGLKCRRDRPTLILRLEELSNPLPAVGLPMRRQWKALSCQLKGCDECVSLFGRGLKVRRQPCPPPIDMSAFEDKIMRR